jgi:hypothetical protein
MNDIKNISWFKKTIEPKLRGYEIKYKFFEKGDFGSLNQVEFNSDAKGGVIDFWGLGWLGLHLYSYQKDEEILNVLLEPDEEIEKTKALEQLYSFIKNE